MKIAAPVSSAKEVEMLLHFGADELYCGVSTPEWGRNFGGQWWMNRRSPSHANLMTWQDLEAVVDAAHTQSAPVHLTVNAPFYPEESIGYLLNLCRKLVFELHVDGLIVSDLNLLTRLSEENLPVRVHLSSLGGCFNAGTANFYGALGVRRIILPRQLRLSEIRHIIEAADARLEFEVFAVNDGCLFEEGFCQTSHALGPFCLTEWQAEDGRVDAKRISAHALDRQMEELRTYRWFQNNCGSSFQHNGLPNGPCSLCWFGHFRDWGVTTVKIVGREASFARKMSSMQLVKAIVDAVESGAAPEAVADLARTIRGTPGYCDAGYMCYFRDFSNR